MDWLDVTNDLDRPSFVAIYQSSQLLPWLNLLFTKASVLLLSPNPLLVNPLVQFPLLNSQTCLLQNYSNLCLRLRAPLAPKKHAVLSSPLPNALLRPEKSTPLYLPNNYDHSMYTFFSTASERLLLWLHTSAIAALMQSSRSTKIWVGPHCLCWRLQRKCLKLFSIVML